MITTDTLADAPSAPTAPAAPDAPAAPPAAEPPASPPAAPETPKTIKEKFAAAAEQLKGIDRLIDPKEEHGRLLNMENPEPQWDETVGRYRDEDGKFVAAEANEAGAAPDGEAVPDATEGEAPAAAGEPPAAAEGEAPAAEPPAVFTETIPGRNGEPIEIEVDDEEAAQALRALKNNGMRREEFTRRMQSVEQAEAERREFETILTTAPELLADQMRPEVKARFLTYLLATHFDELRPTIEAWYYDDIARQRALLDIERGTMKARQDVTAALAEQRRAAEVVRAVKQLIPESASSEDASDFTRVALATLTAVANERGDVNPAEVPTLLVRDLRRFGWMPPAEPAPDTTPSLLATRPATPPAEPGQRAAPGQPKAPAPPARRAAVAEQRKAAAPVVPPGTRAAPAAQLPRVASFKDATRLLRSIDPRTWKQSA